jgi:hypothetical protein
MGDGGATIPIELFLNKKDKKVKVVEDGKEIVKSKTQTRADQVGDLFDLTELRDLQLLHMETKGFVDR